MGRALEHIPVKLTVGLISNKNSRFTSVRRILEKKFGKIDKETPELDFTCTGYYENEMGKNLKRKFFSFKKPARLIRCHGIKLYTNKLEQKLSESGKRTVNIDPGYMSPSKLVLFTTKDRSHRVYIDAGIYGEPELQYIKKTFVPLDWTYPDYRTKEYIDFFNSVRTTYLNQIKDCL